MGICIVRNPPKGKCVKFIYGLIIFFLGFIPMITEGSGMLAVAKITPQSIHDLCKMDPDAAINESKNKFMRNLIKKAHNFDNYSEKVLDQAMCTKTCPCYTERTEAPEDPDTPYVRNDTWHKYSELG